MTPLLAESLPDISADGKTYTIKLRKGIKFHDGSDMTSEDVVASLGRWMKIASRGKQVAGFIDNISAPDAETVTITLKAALCAADLAACFQQLRSHHSAR